MARVTFSTALGRCAISWSERGIFRFELPEASERPDDAATLPPEIEAVIVRTQRHLAGELQDFAGLNYDLDTLPEFARDVYRVLLTVKPGATCSYGDIASALGHPPAVSRAVGSALGANPIPLLIPCHRVIASDGKMTGFSGPGGIKTKLRLLALEGAELFAE